MSRLALCSIAIIALSEFVGAQCSLPVLGPTSGTEVLGSAVVSTPEVIVAGDPTAGATGVIHFYLENYLSWTWEREVLPRAGAPSSSSFGAALAARDGVLLVGAPTHGGPLSSAPNRGSVYVMGLTSVDSGDPIVAPDGASGDLFGTSVACGSGRWVAGAPGSSANAGSASIFLNDPTGSVFEQTVVAADAQPWAQFGAAVAMTDDVLVVGSPGADSFRGAVYVFERTGTRWEQTARLSVVGGQDGDRLGRCVAIQNFDSPLTILAGIPGFDDGVDADAGQVVRFRREGRSTWTEDFIAHPAPEPDAEFGASLVLDSQLLLVGTPGQNNYEGAGFVFTLNSAGTWVLESTVENATGEFSEGGEAVAMADGVAWLGARFAPGGGSVQGFPVADLDCDGSGTGDRCDILLGLVPDTNENGVPDTCEEIFLRGDLDGDGEVDFQDVFELSHSIFVMGTPAPGCVAAADVNTDGRVDVSDVIRLVAVLFVPSSPPLAAPWPSCGLAAGPPESCDVPPFCP